MSFEFFCKHCNQSLEAEDDWVGMQLECPSCNNEITVQNPNFEDTQVENVMVEEDPANFAPPITPGEETDVDAEEFVVEEPKTASVPPPIPPKNKIIKKKKKFQTPSRQTTPQVETPKGSGLAMTGMIFGILSLCCMGPLLGIPGLIFSIAAMIKIKKGKAGGFGMAIAGLVTSIIGIIMISLMVAVMLPALVKARQAARSVVSIKNMVAINQGLIKYAKDHNGQLPKGNNAAGLQELVPKYISDLKVFDDPNAETPPPAPGAKLTDQNCDYGYCGGLSSQSNGNMPVLWEKHIIDFKRKILFINGNIQKIPMFDFKPEKYLKNPQPLKIASGMPSQMSQLSGPVSLPAPQPKKVIQPAAPPPPKKPTLKISANASPAELKALLDKFVIQGKIRKEKFPTDFVKDVPPELSSRLERVTRSTKRVDTCLDGHEQYGWLYPIYGQDEIPRIFQEKDKIYYPIYGTWKWRVSNRWINWDHNMTPIKGKHQIYPHEMTQIDFYVIKDPDYKPKPKVKLTPRAPLPKYVVNGNKKEIKALLDKHLVHGVVYGKYETDFVKGVPLSVARRLDRDSIHINPTKNNLDELHKKYPEVFPEKGKGEIPRMFIKRNKI